MKNIATLAIEILLFLGVLGVVFDMQSVKATRVWTVDDDGSADFHTIQEAINSASPGDTIHVYNGTYKESVFVNKTMSIIGEEYACPFIRGIIKITANDVSISRLITDPGWFPSGGIVLWSVNGCQISDVIAFADELSSFWLWNSSNNIISYNTAKGLASFGIRLDYSSNNIIIANKLHASYGIRLYQSFNNTIHKNIIHQRYFGIQLYESSNNKIFHNNFADNSNQAVSDLINIWDDGYPSGGNYWNDYAGNDFHSGPYQNETGSDGIGDTPYVIDENNQDHYPLMDPYIPLEEMRALYYELLEKYSNLLADHKSLNSTYHEISDNYSQLLTDYNNLNSVYNELKSKYDTTMNELTDTRNLMYILLVTTIILVATTVYFAGRKPKVEIT